MSIYIKKVKEKEVKKIEDYVSYTEGGIISRALVQRDNFSFTFFSFSPGEGISPYAMAGEVLIHVIEGEVSVSIGESTGKTLRSGELIAVPDNVLHGIDSSVPSKIILYIFKD